MFSILDSFTIFDRLSPQKLSLLPKCIASPLFYKEMVLIHRDITKVKIFRNVPVGYPVLAITKFMVILFLLVYIFHYFGLLLEKYMAASHGVKTLTHTYFELEKFKIRQLKS